MQVVWIFGPLAALEMARVIQQRRVARGATPVRRTPPAGEAVRARDAS
jgi:hypothetical protein